MNITHIMAQTMYTQDMYMLINTCFDGTEHKFCTGHAKRKDSLAPIGLNQAKGNAEVINPKHFIRYIKNLDACDAIILHGLFNFKHFIFISRKKEWLEKTCWVIWGGDIYRYNEKSNRWGVKLTEYLKQKYACQIGYVATLVDKDLPLARQWYHVGGKHFSLSYPLPIQRPGVMQKLTDKGNKKGFGKKTVKVMLGNSATLTNCHMDALQELAAFAPEDMKLYIPLTYGFKGSEDYREMVVQEAVRIFGEHKVVPVTESMDGEAYSEFISDMDIGIFYNDRQQAMGNIAIALASGVKIYIRNDTTMWGNYEGRGFRIENAFTLSEETFDTFRYYDPVKKEKNMALIRKYTDINLIRDKWKQLFTEMTAERQNDEKYK